MSNKTVDTLVADIYDLVSTKTPPEGVNLEEEIERFGESMKALMRDQFTREQRDNRTLRLSSIGSPLRQLWHRIRGTQREPISGPTYIKFMYGHVIEEMMVFLTRLAGHSVTDQQKVCEVEGIKGHMDCRIDGLLVDVKSSSGRSFKKFEDGSLAFSDPFGYVAQIKAYAHSEGDTEYGWLAMDKQTGKIALLVYDEKDDMAQVYDKINWDIAERVRTVKKLVGQSTPPPQCHETLPDGKSGNMRLAAGCSYCEFKQSCFPQLRQFEYSTGPKYLTEISRLPNVPEGKLPEVIDASEVN